MSAPRASEIRSSLIASSEIRACSAAVPRPAATSSAPTSFAVQPDRVRLVEPGPPHVLGRGVLEQVFLDGVA